jgi:hypothetical protein
MSGKLIAREGPQTFKDDLESTIYVLLWVALVYSNCSDQDKVHGFMIHTFDPHPGTYSAKPDFLTSKHFLHEVKYPGRPHFDRLLDNLASLFAIRYQAAPTPGDFSFAVWMKGQIESSNPPIPGAIEAYEKIPCVLYLRQLEDLETHKATIKYFEDALKNRSEWPRDDHAEIQTFCQGAMLPLGPVIKSCWSTTFEIDPSEDAEEGMEGIDSTGPDTTLLRP